MFYKKIIILTFSLLLGNAAISQSISVNSTGANPHSSAMLDVSSTNSGLLIPRMTQAERLAISSPAQGLMVYQTNGSIGLYTYDVLGGGWNHLLDSTQVQALISASGDDLGNHIATQNLQLNGKRISNDGDNEGLGVADNGQVYVGASTTGPGSVALRSYGDIWTDGQGTGIYFTNSQIGITGNNSNSGDLRIKTGSANRIYVSAGGGVGINTLSPAYRLDVNGSFSSNSLNVNDAYNFPTVDGTSGQVLQTDGLGNVTWESIAAAGSDSTRLTDTDGDTKIQVEESADEDKIRFDLGGIEYFRMDSGRFEVLNTGNSVFIGENAGVNDDFTDNRNVFIGKNSGASATGSSNNVGIGYNTLSSANLASVSNHVAIGSNALSSISAGYYNVAVGYLAGQNINSNSSSNVIIGEETMLNGGGQRNVAIGKEALRSTSGSENVAIGPGAGFSNTTGAANVLVGKNAGVNKSSGDGNVYVGNAAGEDASANYNVGIGQRAGDNFGGNYNIAIGLNSGPPAGSNGSKNIFLGYQVGNNETGSDKLYINNSSSSTPLIWGDFANDSLKIFGSLSVGNEFTFPTTDGTNGQVLQTDGLGNVTWEAISAAGSDSTRLSDADGDTKIQVEESADEDKIRFDLGGIEYYVFDTARIEFKNYFENIGVGNQTLENITSGSSNIAISTRALQNNTTGFQNIAIGRESMINNTIGIRNLGIGYQALGNNETGIDNVALGYQAGLGSGTHNKSKGVFIGYQAGLNENTSNKLYIENSNSSTPLIWGDFANDSVKIYGSLSVGNEFTFPTTDGTNGQVLQTDGSGNVTWATTSGADDLGNHTATQNIQLNGNYLSNDGDNEGIQINNDGKVAIGGAVQSNSKFYSSSTDKYTARFSNTNNSDPGTVYAVHGTANGVGASTNIALYGEASGTGTNVAVQGIVTGGGNNYSGYFLGGHFYIADSLGVGVGNPSARLDIGGKAEIDTLSINNAFTFPSTDGTNGQVLQTDGSGNVSWATASAAGLKGSGTSGYLPIWLGADTLANSIIQDDGSSLGIGTTAGGLATVNVEESSSDVAAAVYGVHTLNAANTTYGVYGISNSTDKNNAAAVYGRASNGAFAVYGQQQSNASNTVAVNGWNPSGGSNQNFGVKGQTSSSNASSAGVYGFAFHGGNAILAESNARVIEANSYGTRTSSFNAVEINNDATSTTNAINKVGLNISSTSSWTGTNSQNIGLNVNVSGGTENYAALFNGGNVGINTSTPSYNLDVNGTANINTLTVNSAITFPTADGASNNVITTNGSGLLGWTTARQAVGEAALRDTAGVHFMTKNLVTDGNYISGDGDNEGLYLDFSGNVGIGTNSLSAKLDVRGASTDDGAIIKTGNSDASHFISLFPGRLNDPNPFIQVKSGDPIRFASDASGFAEYMRIDGNGYVGIGSTAPTSILTIQDNSTAALTLKRKNANSDSLGIAFQNTGNNYTWNIYQDVTENLHFRSGNSSSLSALTTRFLIDLNGYVGIGMTAPPGMLSIQDNGGGGPGLYLSGFDNTEGDIAVDISDALQIGQWNTATNQFTDRIYIQADGDVGIGTDAPSSNLDVNGDVEVGTSDAFYMGDPNTDGTWRMIRSGNNLNMERRESGVWVMKMQIQP